jgi:hypothetical protein
MGAEREKLGHGIPLLEYGDLVNPEFAQYGVSPILDASRVPIHPLVFESPQFFTVDFARRVLASVPNSIRRDVAEIEAKCGPKVPVKIVERGVTLVRDETLVDEEDITLFSDVRIIKESATDIGLAYYASGFAIDLWADSTRPVFGDPDNLLMSRVKAQYYEVDADKYNYDGMLKWDAHHRGYARLPLQLILRSFAIMFNNLGLEELGVK